MDDPLEGPARAVCTSCGGMRDQRDRCRCVVVRATAVASLAYEQVRAVTPGWRRPRMWSRLPQHARAALVHGGIDLVELLEGHGWRLVRVDGPLAAEPGGVHALPDDYVPARGSVTATIPIVPALVPLPLETVPKLVPLEVQWPRSAWWPEPARADEYDFHEDDLGDSAPPSAHAPELARPYVAPVESEEGTARMPPVYRAPDTVQ